MMFALRTLYGLMALLALAAFAQPMREGREIAEPAKPEVREPARDAETQQRRALLRASLRTQPEVAVVVREAPANGARLLSDEERASLRQQLRQQ